MLLDFQIWVGKQVGIIWAAITCPPPLIGMGLLEIPNAHPAHLLVAVLLLFLNRSRSQSIILNTITKGSAGIAEQLKIFLFNFIFGMIRTFFFSFAWSYRIHKDVR